MSWSRSIKARSWETCIFLMVWLCLMRPLRKPRKRNWKKKILFQSGFRQGVRYCALEFLGFDAQEFQFLWEVERVDSRVCIPCLCLCVSKWLTIRGIQTTKGAETRRSIINFSLPFGCGRYYNAYYFTEGLSILTSKVMGLNLFEPAVLGTENVVIWHLQYASDMIFMGAGSMENVRTLKYILKNFELLLGLKINYSKSWLLGINMGPDLLANMASILSCEIGSIPFSYLGIKVGANHKRQLAGSRSFKTYGKVKFMEW